MEKKKIIIFLLGITAILVWMLFFGQAGNSAFFGEVNFIDEGQFAAWVSHMLHGKLIYRDIYVQYGPLMIYPVYFMMKFFGITIFFVRLWIILSAYLGYVVAIITLLRLRVNKVIFILSSIALLLVPGVNIRQWIAVLIFIMLIEAYRKKSIVLGLFTGVLIATAVLQSVEVGLLALMITGMCVGIRLIGNTKLRQELKIGTSIFIGLIAVSFVFYLISQSQGWFLSYITTTKDFASSIVGMNLPNGQGLPSLTRVISLKTLFSKSMLFYLSLFLLLTAFTISFIRCFIVKRKTNDILALLVSVFSICIYVTIIGRSGHYIAIFPYVVVLFAYIITQVGKCNISKKLYFICLTLFCLFLLRHVAIYRYGLFPNFKTQTAIHVKRVSPLAISENQSKVIVELQSFFEQNTRNTDTIYLADNNPGLYFLLNRENATIYDLPLLAGTLELRLQTVSQLERAGPKYIILDESAWAVDGVSDRVRQPEVFEFIKNKYKAYKKIGSYTVYRRT